MQLRLDSSSGGIFSLLAQSILSQGGVVFGVGYDEDLRVVHKAVDGHSVLSDKANSSLVQSLNDCSCSASGTTEQVASSPCTPKHSNLAQDTRISCASYASNSDLESRFRDLDLNPESNANKLCRTRATSQGDLLDSLRRSKYVQSDKGNSFKEVKALLKQGRKVLFSGVQCEIQGLLAYLKKPYENLLTCEVICNSVPSPKVWEIYKQSLCEEEECAESNSTDSKVISESTNTTAHNPQSSELDSKHSSCAKTKILDFNFRGKDYGWENGVFAVKTKTKTKTIPHYESSFMRGFLDHLITRPSCENCYAKDGRSGADITLGDFWGVGRAHPEFSDNIGVSCVIAHNAKALSVLESIKDLGEWELSSYEAIVAGNKALIKSGFVNPKRRQALKDIIDTYNTKGARESIKALERYLIHRAKPSLKQRARRQIAALLPKRSKVYLKNLVKNLLRCDKKIHIAIATFVDTTNNYGQVMQAYALQKYLSQTYPKVDISFIDVHKILIPKSRRVWRAFKKYGILGFVRKFVAKIQARCTPHTPTPDEVYNKSCDDLRGLDTFRQSFMRAPSRTFNNLYFHNIPKADIFIAGSDQIWNSWGIVTKENFCVSYLYHYLFGFVDKRKRVFRNAKKIAYAPSIGSTSIPKELQGFFAQYLRSFDALSVREECNVDSLKELGLESICVPDPTMLLSREDYLSIAKPLARESEVFVYMLGHSTMIDKDALLDFVASTHKILYANANLNAQYACAYDDNTEFYPTPQEWIGAIADSKALITNSFHGCVFAIIMNTPFFALKLGGGAGAMNTRFESLLEIFGLQDRLCSDLEEFKHKFAQQAPIDWQAVNARLGAWSQVGKDYLAKNVGVYAV